MMNNIIEIYDNYTKLGILTRKNTQGKEFELVKEFIEHRKKCFLPTDNNKLAIFVEPKVNNSYPDIVFVEYNPENFENWQNSRSELGLSDFKILYHIYISKLIDSTSIVSQLGVTWKDAMLSIEKLLDTKLISRKNVGWCIKNKESIAVTKIEAVEAKINKVEEVFQQALINKNFASESYILSELTSKPQEAKLEKLNHFGIGVYMKKENEFQVINNSKKSSIPVSFNSIYFNEWIGRILFSKGRND